MVITMSDPVTNVEIEDVLSSIRRLVSEEGRDKPRKRREPDPAVENRLVLTPALRIAEREDEAARTAPEVVSDDVNAEADVPVDLSADFSEDAPSDEIEFHETETLAEGEDAALPSDPDEAPALLDVAWITEESTVEPFVLKARSDDGAESGLEDEAPDAEVDDAPDAEVDEALDLLVDEYLGESDENAAPEDTTADAEEPSAPEVPEVLALDTPPPFIRAVPEPESIEEDADEAAAHADSDTEDAPWSDPDATLHEAAARAEAPEDLAVEDADSLPKGERMRRAAMLSAKIQALEAAIAETPDQWEPDGASADDYAGTEVDGLAWQQDEPRDPESQDSEELEEIENAGEMSEAPGDLDGWSEPDEAVNVDAAPDDDTTEPEAQGEEDDLDTSAPADTAWGDETGAESAQTGDVDHAVDVDVEEALADSIVAEILPAEDMGDPEAFELDNAAQTASDPFDAAEPASHETISDAEPLEVEADVADHVFSGFEVEEVDDVDTDEELMGADAFLDEDMLRELVSQIVRQELQGALGERITRNVRKLVRREIHRAMTTQELD